MEALLVIPGPASRELGLRVAEHLNCEVIDVTFKVFPDGESYIRFSGDVRGSNVVVVQSTPPPQDSNLIRLFLLLDNAKRLGAERVIAVVPYLAYSRQDKIFLEGEAVSINTVIKLIEASGADCLYTFNIHSIDIMKRFTIPAYNLSAIPVLAEHLKRIGFSNAVSVAPDKGAVKLVEEADKVLNGGYGWLEKYRDRVTGEIRMEAKEIDVKGKDAVVFDDIISTGGTMAEAVKILKELGARRVYVACTHPLMLGNSESKLLDNGAEGILGTDTIPGKFSSVSIAKVIAESISKLG